ncbi:MAG: response regulator transcription factor [Polyangiales bacterium]
MVRVFVADDHRVVCEGLRSWIESTDGLRWVGAAHDAETLVELAPSTLWDVLVLDLSLLGTPSVELLARVRAIKPEARVVIFSMYPASDYRAWTLAAGASAYVSKAAPLDALRAALFGELTDEAPADDSAKMPHEKLAPRELEVFLAIAGGLTPSEIAWELELAPSTVSTHLKSVRKKLNVSSTLEIAQYAARLGIQGRRSRG